MMEDINDIKKAKEKIALRKSRRAKDFNSPKKIRCFEDLKATSIFQEVNSLIKNGNPESFIADFIRKEKGELKGYTRREVMAMLRSYRKTLSPAEVSANIVPKSYVNKVKELSKGVDVLLEMTDIYRIQKKRVETAIAGEEKKKALYNNTYKEIGMCLEILQSIGETQANLGITERNLGTVTVDAQLLSIIDDKIKDRGARRILQNPEARRKMLELAENISSSGVEVLDAVGRKLKAIPGGKAIPKIEE